jgi:anti-sigma factor RsiW
MDTDPLPELPAEVKQHMTRYKAPPGLERRIRHMLLDEEARRPGLAQRLSQLLMRWTPVGASFAFGALMAVGVMTWHDTAITEREIEEEVVSSHVRSLMANHLTDVASTDRHTVKPWFTGKLDYAPPVVDLAQEGFPLVGGRLDYLQGRPVAALVYHRRGHVINVFVLSAGDARGRAMNPKAYRGFQLAEWEGGGMRYWAVSDVAREEMTQFVAAMKAAQ